MCKSRAYTPGAYHVQHIVCLVVRRDTSAIRCDRAQIAFISAETIIDEGEKTKVPGKPPDDMLHKIPHTEAQKFKPQPRLKFENWHSWLALDRKADVLTVAPHVGQDLGNCLDLCPSSLSLSHRLVGLVVKASTSTAEDPGFESRLHRDFSGVESYQ